VRRTLLHGEQVLAHLIALLTCWTVDEPVVEHLDLEDADPVISERVAEGLPADGLLRDHEVVWRRPKPRYPAALALRTRSTIGYSLRSLPMSGPADPAVVQHVASSTGAAGSGMRQLRLVHFRPVRSCHECREVLRVEERRWPRRTPLVEPSGALEDVGGPERVVEVTSMSL
jgi:hypothetical protein